MILLLDEMYIKSELRYNSPLDLIDGFETKCFERTKSIGKQICVFMLKSLISSWGIVLNYFVSKSGLSAVDLKEIIFNNLKILKGINIQVKVVICDQGSSNRKCFSELGVTPEKPFFFHDSCKVFCMFDFPHLLKSLRNGWLSCDLATPDGVVTFRVVRELWEKEMNSTTKMCPKLSRQHIYPNSFEKMKVKLAAQIFSHTVEAAVNTVNDTVGFKCCSKTQASATASFIGKINKIFDCLNSSSLHSKDIYKSAIKINSPSHDFVKYFKQYLSEISFVDKKKKVFFLDGMLLSITSVLQLVDELLTNNNNMFFLMTRSLNQDKLENMFSILRQKGGNNTNPSVAEINNIFARLMSAKIVQMTTNANCEEINDSTFEELSNILTDKDCVLNTEHLNDVTEFFAEANEINSITTDDFLNLADVNLDLVSVRYFIGYIAFKILPKLNCSLCSSEIKKEDEVLSAPSELFIFHKNYQSLTDFGNLVAPSQSFLDVSTIHIGIFRKVFVNEPQSLGIKE